MTALHERPARGANGTLFGVPVGELGWFSSLLIGLSTGFLTFFAATFAGIVAILLYNSFGHHTVDYSLSYRRGGLPVGITCGVLALVYLGFLWSRRIVRGR